jgi:hypothetical protein
MEGAVDGAAKGFSALDVAAGFDSVAGPAANGFSTLAGARITTLGEDGTGEAAAAGAGIVGAEAAVGGVLAAIGGD